MVQGNRVNFVSFMSATNNTVGSRLRVYGFNIAVIQSAESRQIVVCDWLQTEQITQPKISKFRLL